MTTKENIIACVQEVSRVRPPKKDFLKFLQEESDYFTAPASTKFHGAHPGGLAEHSFSVYKLLDDKAYYHKMVYLPETLVLVGLFHDLCKVNFYKLVEPEPVTPAQKSYLMSLQGHCDGVSGKNHASRLIDWYKKGKQGEFPLAGPEYVVEDQLPIGHGEKSLYILSQYFDLTNDEAMAIRWHMSAFDGGVHSNYPSGLPFRQASDSCPLVTLLFTADFEASNILKK